MVVRFFRLTIEGKSESSLQSIKNWFDNKIDSNDLDDKLVGRSTSLFEDEFNHGNFTFSCDMYIKSTTPHKYVKLIKDKFKNYDKTGLTSAKVIQYDNCSHDEEFPQPCQPTIRMEWNA